MKREYRLLAAVAAFWCVGAPVSAAATSVDWVTQFGDQSPDTVALALNPSGYPCVLNGTELNIKQFSSAGGLLWQQSLSSSAVSAADIAIDQITGDIYIVGAASDRNYVKIGLLEKFSSSGALQWSKELVGCKPYAVTTDADGNCYVAGYNYGASSITYNTDAYVVKFDSSAQTVWENLYNVGTGGETGVLKGFSDVAVDADGNVYLCGTTIDDINGDQVAAFREEHYDAFAVKYYAQGARAWITYIATIYLEYGQRLVVDASGNAYVAGISYGDLNGNAHVGGKDVFVCKLNSSGSAQWTNLFGTRDDESASDITFDPDGNLVVGSIKQTGKESNIYDYYYTLTLTGLNTSGGTISSANLFFGDYLAVTAMASETAYLYIAGSYSGDFAGYSRSGSGYDFLMKCSMKDKDDVLPKPSNVKVYRGIFKPGQSESCQLQYTLDNASEVDINVYDSLGVKVRQLYAGAVSGGVNTITWDGTDDSGSPVPSGVYVIRAMPNTEQKKVVVIR